MKSLSLKTKSLILCSLALSLSLVACGVKKDDNTGNDNFTYNACNEIGAKIFGGEECKSERTAVVRIEGYYRDGSSLSCTGSIISSRAVLTAAHCLVDDPVVLVVTVDGQTFRTADYVIHPGVVYDLFNTVSVFNDVGLVFVSSNLPLAPIPMLISRNVSTGEEGLIAGYGLTENQDLGKLLAGNVIVDRVSSNHIFTAYTGDNSNPCVGDSGGPLLINDGGVFTIAGTVSSGTPETDCNVGDVTLYANLANPEIYSFILDYVPDAAVR